MLYAKTTHEFIEKNYEDLIALSKTRLKFLNEEQIIDYLHDFIAFMYRTRLISKYDPARGGSFNTFITKSLYNFYSCKTKGYKFREDFMVHNEYILDIQRDNSTESPEALIYYSLSQFMGKLSTLEVKILNGLINSKKYAEIGEALGMSKAATGWHVQNIRKKLKNFRKELFF